MSSMDLDAATMHALKLAAPWPLCHDCGENHDRDTACYPNGAHVVRIIGGIDHAPPRYLVEHDDAT